MPFDVVDQFLLTNDELAHAAPAFDALADKFLPRVFLQNNFGDCAIVDMERMIRNLAAQDDFVLPQVRFNTDEPVTTINGRPWPVAIPPREIRFNHARAVAKTLIIKHETQGLLGDDEDLRHTVSLFNAASRLYMSGMDYLACAILMPKNVFNNVGQRYLPEGRDSDAENNFIINMAGIFDLPRSVIAFRMLALKHA